MNTRHFLPLMLTAALAAAPPWSGLRTPADAAIQRPDAQAPFLESHEAAYRQDAPPGRWWRLHDDPALDGLVEQALAANTDLRVAAANLERAQAATREAQAQQQPSVGVNASPTFGHVSGLQGCSRASIPSRWSYSAGASVSYQLDLFGQIRRAVEAASGDEAAPPPMTPPASPWPPRPPAPMPTCAPPACGVRPAFARGAKSSLDAIERLQRAGRGTALDVTRARSQLQQLQANLPPFQAQQRTALYRWPALTGTTRRRKFPPACCNAPRRRA